MNDIADAFYKLKKYCEREDFKGWDPYDGLNSKVFQALPLLKKSALCRKNTMPKALGSFFQDIVTYIKL